jgi:putative two-component system response regulator
MPVPQDPATRVLLLGYEPLEQEQLDRALRAFHYELTPAASERDALRLLQRERFAAVLLDVSADSTEGARTVHRLSAAAEAPAVVVLTATNDATVAAACFREGASDYLVQVPEPATLDAALRAAIQRRNGLVRQAEVHEVLQDELAKLRLRLRRARRGSAAVSMGTLGSLVSMMEIRDHYLAGHSVRVAQLAASMAAELGHSARDVEEVRASGRLHDIGMLCVSEGILSKAGPLTPQEFERVKQHVVIADQILKEVPQLDRIRSFVRSHHERWDGTGYPDRLAGEAIPWGSRLIGAAEIYDALTTSRPYKSAITPDEAIEQMETLSGTAIAPEVYDALVTIVQNGRALVFIGEDDQPSLAALEATDSRGKDGMDP